MQVVRVLDSSPGDYLHDDEIVELDHVAAGRKHRLLVKNLEEEEAIGSEAAVGIYVPVESIASVVIKEGHCVIVLSECPDEATGAERKARVSQMAQAHEDSSK
jgi:hypothetical protein